MTRVVTRVGPADHGRAMSLEDFDHAEVNDGHLYELSRGIITVSDVPDLRHMSQVDVLNDQLRAYRLQMPGRVYRIAGGSDCKILVDDLQSERHPDVAVYRNAPLDTDDIWRTWVPDLVVEVVSESSRHRDYEEKPEEYLRFGVSEYRIVDHAARQMVVPQTGW
jgi:Uma2 family endonuclease